ncbi:hypothetical protein LIER_26458 [Lithospermum erythrorhizon]|uniref:Uncharacterized protein n=1 Tax=Lithospermum erythrorhizon TaxID=34254 RepID=A0AAV3R8G3_LITER
MSSNIAHAKNGAVLPGNNLNENEVPSHSDGGWSGPGAQITKQPSQSTVKRTLNIQKPVKGMKNLDVHALKMSGTLADSVDIQASERI